MPVRILICYKNFTKDTSVSHVGLGITAANTAKTLSEHGYYARALPIFGADDLGAHIHTQENTSRAITHVVIMAQWIPSLVIAKLVRAYPHIKFAQTCHSNPGFLAAEPPAISLLRRYIDLETGTPNFHVAGNNMRLVMALQNAYGRPITYLPNLYYIHGHEPIHRHHWRGGTLKVGIYGSHRPYKNMSTAVLAALELTHFLKCNTEIWMNTGRTDGAGTAVYRTAVAWTEYLPHVKLKDYPWSSWPDFKRQVAMMNIMLAPSYTETFNNTTADGICEGTPSVVSPAIEWCPESWKAEPDDPTEIATVARRLLMDPFAAQEGFKALSAYIKNGLPYWVKFLDRL